MLCDGTFGTRHLEEFSYHQDTDITYLQVDESGKLPYPAVVGREDVAALAVAAAMLQTGNVTTHTGSSSDEPTDHPPFHMNLAVRWCGEIDPPHAGVQGKREDGCIDADTALQKVLFDSDMRRTKRNRKVNPSLLRRFAQQLTRRHLKPYAIFVAIPVYMMLGLMLTSVLTQTPAGERWLALVRDRVLPQVWVVLKQIYATGTGIIPDVRRLVSQRRIPKYIGV